MIGRLDAPEAHPGVRAVIDTSTLVHPSLRREIQQQAALGRFVAIWSPWIVGELHRVLTWRWLRRRNDFGQANWRECSAQAKIMMELLLPVFLTVAPIPPYPSPWESLEDRYDIPIWAAAKHGQANYVVSENSTDFPPADAQGRHIWEGIEYMSGSEFLRRLEVA